MKTLLANEREIVGAVGLLILSGGLALLSVPVALIVAGGLLFALAVWPYVIPQKG